MIITQFPLTGAQTWSICTDGIDLWVADGLLGGVWKVTTSGAGTFYSLTGSAPVGICYGPDGNLWVADGNGPIWKVTPSGVGTSYTAAPPGQFTVSICVGSDGNLWAINDSGFIMQCTTSGVVTSFAITQDPDQICSGPDGNLWVSHSSSFSGVSKVTTAGVETYWAISGANLLGICSDGVDLWLGANTISDGLFKVDTSGGQTHYTSGFGNMKFDAICYGPDGNLRSVGDFQPGSPAHEGFVILSTTSGVAGLQDVFPTVTPPGFLSAICVGPDGNFYITDTTTGHGIWQYAFPSGTNAIVMIV